MVLLWGNLMSAMGIVSFRKELTIDGIRYATTVVETDLRKFYAFWYCRDCDKPGTPNELASTLDQAHAMAKEDLQRHHQSQHA